MQTSKLIYSVFSGTFYHVPEKDIHLLDIGQIPLKETPKKCSTCFSRGHIGRDKNTNAYEVCNCIIKKIDFECVKNIKTNNYIT